MYAEVDFLKNFTIRTSIGGTIDNEYYYDFTPNRYQDKEFHTSVNAYSENSLFNSSWIWTNTLTYTQSFGKHNVKLLVGTEAIKNTGRAVGGSSSGLFSTDPFLPFFRQWHIGCYELQQRLFRSVIFIIWSPGLHYNNKYLFSATVRRDGSSRFGVDETYGVFPSFSGGWRLSAENFMQNITWVNDLKLRGSWGKLGSQNNVNPTNPFTLFNSNFGLSYYDINGAGSISQGFYQSNIGNVNTGWEQDVELQTLAWISHYSTIRLTVMLTGIKNQSMDYYFRSRCLQQWEGPLLR